jgi:hypothetical protein
VKSAPSVRIRGSTSARSAEEGGKVLNLAIIALVLTVVFLVIHGVLPRWHR